MINQKCMEFNTKYNTKRFHAAIGHKTPWEYVIEKERRTNRSLCIHPGQQTTAVV
jgi:hypothetical protein